MKALTLNSSEAALGFPNLSFRENSFVYRLTHEWRVIRRTELTITLRYTNLWSILESAIGVYWNLRLCFPQILACSRACGIARQDEEKFRDCAREWRCIMKTSRSLELMLALLYSREQVFCKLLRDTRISYFVQVLFSSLIHRVEEGGWLLLLSL